MMSFGKLRPFGDEGLSDEASKAIAAERAAISVMTDAAYVAAAQAQQHLIDLDKQKKTEKLLFWGGIGLLAFAVFKK